MPLTIGSRIGPYQIASPLGAGGMGEVYRARDTKLQRDVAVKVLTATLAGDAAALGERLGVVLSDGTMRLVTLASGMVMPLAERTDFFGSTWTESDEIVFTRDRKLWRVAAPLCTWGRTRFSRSSSW
jgi:serine/threonine protein kinase